MLSGDAVTDAERSGDLQSAVTTMRLVRYERNLSGADGSQGGSWRAVFTTGPAPTAYWEVLAAHGGLTLEGTAFAFGRLDRLGLHVGERRHC